MKLTRRQFDILCQMYTLQEEFLGDPIHYSTLAERLSTSNSTAYHMLRVLEDKGYVVSKLHYPKKRIGRSSVRFDISAAGRDLLTASILSA